MNCRLPLGLSVAGETVAIARGAGRSRRFCLESYFKAAAIGLALATLTAGGLAGSEPPVLGSLRPRVARPGQTVRIEIVGRFPEPDVEVVSDLPAPLEILDASANNRRALQVRIPSQIPAGLYRFQLRTQTGISNPMFFFAGGGPQAGEEESEPGADGRRNDSPESAQRVRQTPAIIHGTLGAGDKDYYSVYGKGTERRTFELEGRRLDLPETLSLRILTLRGSALAQIEGSAALDHPVTVRFPAEGFYLVEVANSQIETRELYYRLRMGAPRGKIP